MRLNESPELIAQECRIRRVRLRFRLASMKVLSLLLRNPPYMDYWGEAA